MGEMVPSSGVADMGGCPFNPDGKRSLADLNFTDPAIQARPAGFYRLLREGAPVHYDESLGMYLVSRYQDVDIVLRDAVTFSQERGYYKQWAYGYLDELKDILVRNAGGFIPDVVNIDPPRHRRARRLTEQAFTRRRIKLLEPGFEALVGQMIDKLADRGEADGLKDLALPMSISFIIEKLKVPDLDFETIRRWANAYNAQYSLMQTRVQFLANATQICELQNYVIALVRKRQAERDEDMLSDVIDARIDDANPALSFEELVAMGRAMLIGAHDSISTALTNLLFKVATDPEIAARFYESADNDARMGRFVEELLRLEPPVRALSRITTKEVELGGQRLPEGAHLLVLYASANDDENVFSCPRNFDMDRPNLARHLSFGAGAHLCLGITLARMELRIAGMQIAKRLKDIRLAIPVEEIRYVPTVATLTMERLPLIFSRR
jgi:cytochrome P450